MRESHSNKIIRSNDLMRSHQSISKAHRFSLPCYLIRTTGDGREKVQTFSESCFAFLNSGGKLINCHNNLASRQRLTHLHRELIYQGSVEVSHLDRAMESNASF